MGLPSITAGIYTLVQGATTLVFHLPRPGLLSVAFGCLLTVAFGCLLYVLYLACRFSESRLLTPSLAAVANLWIRLRSSADFVTGSLVGWPPLNILVELGTVLS